MLLFAAALIATNTASGATIFWNTDASGLWNTPGVWAPSLPLVGDDVVIDRPNAALVVTHNAAHDIIDNLTCNETLVLAGGTLDVAGTMQVNGACTLGGATLGGTGTVRIAGTMNAGTGTISNQGGIAIAAGGTFAITTGSGNSLYLSGVLLENAGTITQSGAGNFCGQGTNATIRNLAGGLYDCQSNFSISQYGGSGQTFDNAGTFRKSTATGSSLVNWSFNNSGTVDVKSGTLRFAGGGSDSGVFSVSPKATLVFSGGTHNFTGCTFSNAGTILLSNGTLNFNSPQTIPGATTFSAGTISGSGTVTFGNLLWSGGTISGGAKAVIPVGGNMTISGSLVRYFSSGSLSNAGSIVWYASNDLSGIGYGNKIDNLHGGVIDCRGDSSFLIASGASDSFNNAGVFRKSGGTTNGATTVAWTFNNSGDVRIDAGTLRLTGGGAYGGTFEIASKAKLELKSGSHVLAGAAFKNDGQLLFTGGTFATNAPISITGTGTTVVAGTGVTLTATSIVQNSLTIGSSQTAATVPEPSIALLVSLAALAGSLFIVRYALDRWDYRFLRF
jgi:hypothetical protein